ncbi:MAG: mannose-1-phosphate guanylyltransferase/mannose-6-phosphate isomerase [Spirochaetales bacterium]|jgi:mannose-1-phosphate guanylyltransferase/mannose-6-phosphate isomerase|nr:mannose-1-phosphate guanylyltransferase/mannose-6-phosphate isomerase [Spirochaetales bacterium]
MIIPVILCGGSGTRLWPLSRRSYPKQLLALTGKQTLLQQTVTRLDGLADVGAPIVICNEEHRFLVAEQLRAITAEPCTIILEPVGRNTCPAAAVAALHGVTMATDASLLILPADHLIADGPTFLDGVACAESYASQGQLVAFGIKPTSPETGYGYIKAGSLCGGGRGHEIDCFVEKPDLPKATMYVDSGEYLWNSGMYLFKAATFLKELAGENPVMLEHCTDAYGKSKRDLDFLRLDKDSFGKCPDDSIDYAIMEKTSNGIVIPIDPGWNDIGSWSALWEVGQQDTQGNVISGDVINYGTCNSYIHAENRLVATAGLDDHIVVETSDAVLVCAKGHVQDVKQLVNMLKAQRRPETNLHRRVYRPWGSYEGVSFGERFQVKLITVNPGSILSLQMHHHRAEHWVVVSGTARITKGEEVFVVSENESTFIPLGVTHRLQNPGVIPLELIEVQSGSYLGEEDIVRFEDHYGRTEGDA